MRRPALALLAAVSAACVLAAPAAAEFGIASVSASLSGRQAGEHADLHLAIELASDRSGGVDEAGFGRPYGRLRDLRVELPPGLVGDLGAVTTCGVAEFVSALGGAGCPFSAQVGIARLFVGLSPNRPMTVPIYSVQPTRPDSVARFGFFVSTVPTFVEARLRSEGDYGVTVEASGISTLSTFQAAELTLWGVPGASAHDNERLTTVESVSEFRSSSPPRSFGRAAEPFLANPARCGQPLAVRFAVASYASPEAWSTATAPLGELEGCPRLRFEPRLGAAPTSTEAAAPSGLDVVVDVPQDDSPGGLATPPLRAAELLLPRGLSASPGAADGLRACTDAEAGYGALPPPPSACPEASRIASAEIDSPALARPLRGAVYLRTPLPGRPFRLWLLVDDLGVRAKLPGELALDPDDGRIAASFAELPQVPVRRLELRFKGGSRGILSTPPACGALAAEWSLAPWSEGAPARGAAPMSFDRGCAGRAFGPALEAGSASAQAARFSPFLVDLAAEPGPGAANLAGLRLMLPPGLLARLAGVGRCPEAAAPSAACPPHSRIGSLAVAAGPGPSPLWLPQPGAEPPAVFLAGPYLGAPFSLLARVPVQAGPFDLGTVVARARIDVDPDTARIRVETDPLPQIVAGVPVSYRRLRVDLDRPRFARNPSSCAPLHSVGVARSAAAEEAVLADRFQVAGCSRLRFRPRFGLRLGASGRGAHPSLRAVVRMPARGANLSRADVALPRSVFLDPGRIGTVCTRPRFAAGNCPARSVYGFARAWTPLLDRPLRGPVYLRSSPRPLPDLVADLRGEVRIVLDGALSSRRGGMRAIFAGLPDAPVSRFELRMPGGRRGLLVNSRDLCSSGGRGRVRLSAQNGARRALRPPLARGCDGKAAQ